MSSKRLRDEDIEDFLGIPSGTEDREDFSEAESDEDIEKIQSSVNFFSEYLTDVETSPQIHLRLPPVNEDVHLSRVQKITNTQPSISGVTSARTSGENR
ncbi:unnamed protein product [Parnassius apollo]|uniref:(apollo) hypothetical protein n=1 Tax=Parnassius apollo TaxID=110799 RepID=A0A8S3YAN2_PARAO|nr:unnamed protein product [Parnassius apollo]